MNTSLPPRIALANLPTPLVRLDRLSETWGGPTIWVKRDDLTGFELSGNKIRKLEFHLAAARDAGADRVVTCGAAQSNHCRATALAAARIGLGCTLLLRTPDGLPPEGRTGNHLLDLLAGADVRYITPDDYAQRDRLMADVASESNPSAWIIPEGASDALGMWGFVLAMQELADQLVIVPGRPAIWHAASSAGTTAGMGWGADRLGLDNHIIGASVGDPAEEVEEHVIAIWNDAVDRWGGRLPEPNWEVTDRYVGLGYGRSTAEELTTQARASAATGLLFDPTYTGKALHGLRTAIEEGRFARRDHVVFWHTGGGFALFSHDWSAALES